MPNYRGKQKAPLTSTRTDDGKYIPDEAHNQIKNLKRQLKRAKEKIERMKSKERSLLEANSALTNAVVNNAPGALKLFDTSIVESRIRSDYNATWTPLKLAVAQLEDQSRSISYTAIETFRSIEQGEEHVRKLVPSRSAVQKLHAELSAGGENVVTHPRYSPQHDFVDLDAHCIVETALDRLQWPGIPADTASPDQVAQLPAFCVDGTADGARMTEHKGMVIQALKFVSPEVVSRLQGSNKKRKRDSSTAGADTEHVQEEESAAPPAETSEHNNTVSSSNNTVNGTGVNSECASYDGVQSTRCVVLTGFLQGSDKGVVGGCNNSVR